MNHLEAKRICDSLVNVTANESLGMRLVSWHESNYGGGWKGAGAGSNNMGAITGSGDAGSFRHGDSINEGSGVRKYETNFGKWSTPEAGFAALARTMLKPNVRQACARQDIPGIAHAMYVNSYYTGVNPRSKNETDRANLITPGDVANVHAYTSALVRAYVTITAATGERWGTQVDPLAVAGKAPAAALPLSAELCLSRLSRLLPRVDANEHQALQGEIIKFQARHELKQDGIVGPVTWRLILERGIYGN